LSSYRLFIPTRDSARWIGAFLDAYRRIGVEPFYVVDERSVDETIDILRERRADYVLFKPHAEYVEAGAIEFGSRRIGAPWALRLDDDEFPSRALVAWIDSGVLDQRSDACVISRREVSLVGGRFAYSRWPTRYGWNGRFDVINPQLRLHRVDGVRYVERLHTTGVEPPAKVDVAPNDCFIIHCNNLLRSAEDRLEKVRRYARIDAWMSWRVADECLPELTSQAAHDFCFDGLDEFFDLFDALPIVVDSTVPSLNGEEMRLLLLSTQDWLAESARLAQALHRRDRERFRALMSSNYIFVPHMLRRPLAEFVMSLGRLLAVAAIEELGLRLWGYYEATSGFTRDYRPAPQPGSPQESFTRSKCRAGS
jgi:hypothetical protein